MSMYQRILVPLDGSVTAERGLREAIDLAALTHAVLHLLYVTDDFQVLAGMGSIEGFQDTLDGLRRYGDALLAKARAACAEAGVRAEASLRELTHETVADAIVAEARESACDLIVMGTHGRRGIRRLTMGSQAELVLRGSPTPVLLVRREDAASRS
jgi:nucleotide-binding universal stress UspA family protein